MPPRRVRRSPSPPNDQTEYVDHGCANIKVGNKVYNIDLDDMPYFGSFVSFHRKQGIPLSKHSDIPYFDTILRASKEGFRKLFKDLPHDVEVYEQVTKDLQKYLLGPTRQDDTWKVLRQELSAENPVIKPPLLPFKVLKTRQCTWGRPLYVPQKEGKYQRIVWHQATDHNNKCFSRSMIMYKAKQSVRDAAFTLIYYMLRPPYEDWTGAAHESFELTKDIFMRKETFKPRVRKMVLRVFVWRFGITEQQMMELESLGVEEEDLSRDVNDDPIELDTDNELMKVHATDNSMKHKPEDYSVKQHGAEDGSMKIDSKDDSCASSEVDSVDSGHSRVARCQHMERCMRARREWAVLKGVSKAKVTREEWPCPQRAST